MVPGGRPGGPPGRHLRIRALAVSQGPLETPFFRKGQEPREESLALVWVPLPKRPGRPFDGNHMGQARARPRPSGPSKTRLEQRRSATTSRLRRLRSDLLEMAHGSPRTKEELIMLSRETTAALPTALELVRGRHPLWLRADLPEVRRWARGIRQGDRECAARAALFFGAFHVVRRHTYSMIADLPSDKRRSAVHQ